MTETIVGVVGAAFLVAFGIAYIVEMRRDSARRRRDEEAAIRRLREATITMPGGGTMRLFADDDFERKRQDRKWERLVSGQWQRPADPPLPSTYPPDDVKDAGYHYALDGISTEQDAASVAKYLVHLHEPAEATPMPLEACVAEATEAAFREVAVPLEDMPVPVPCATYPDTTNMAPEPEPCRAVEPVSFSAPDPPPSYDPPSSSGGGDL